MYERVSCYRVARESEEVCALLKHAGLVTGVVWCRRKQPVVRRVFIVVGESPTLARLPLTRLTLQTGTLRRSSDTHIVARRSPLLSDSATPSAYQSLALPLDSRNARLDDTHEMSSSTQSGTERSRLLQHVIYQQFGAAVGVRSRSGAPGELTLAHSVFPGVYRRLPASCCSEARCRSRNSLG